MIKRSPIKHRKTPRAIAKKKKREEVRLAVFKRSGGRCEVNNRYDCIKGVLPFKSAGNIPYDHGHLVHLKSEGSGGKTDMENCRWGCWKCHLLGLHRGETKFTKPVPAKVPRPDWAEGYYGN